MARRKSKARAGNTSETMMQAMGPLAGRLEMYAFFSMLIVAAMVAMTLYGEDQVRPYMDKKVPFDIKANYWLKFFAGVKYVLWGSLVLFSVLMGMSLSIRLTLGSVGHLSPGSGWAVARTVFAMLISASFIALGIFSILAVMFATMFWYRVETVIDLVNDSYMEKFRDWYSEHIDQTQNMSPNEAMNTFLQSASTWWDK